MKVIPKLAIVSTLALCGSAFAAPKINVPVYLTAEHGVGKSVGNVVITQSPQGAVFTPHLHGLPPGQHGIHIHVTPSCDNLGQAAGGHLDPAQTGKHEGPQGQGHLGDLPALQVNDKGEATQPFLAPRMTLNDLTNHSLMIHEGGDNYSDQPKPLGGGGARIACGIIGKISEK